MKIIVWEDKHSTKYYDASTPEAWDASAIEILRELTDEPYGYMNPEYAKPFISDDDRRLAGIDLDTLPTDARDELSHKVTQARAHIEREERGYRRAQEEYALALSYIKAGKSPMMVRGKGYRGEHPVPSSWLIVESRSGYEYENFSTETVWTRPEETE